MQLFPVVAELVVDPNSQVRLSSTEAMILITKPHTVEVLLGQILHVLQQLTEEKLEDEFRIEAMRIIHHLSPLVGPETCLRHFVQYLLAFSKDSFRVRTALAGFFGNVAQVLGAELVREHLWSIYAALCEDEIWGVRRACAESIVVVSEVMGSAYAAEKITPLFVAFLRDTSRWVRSAAYAYLGRYIATLDGADTNELIVFYNEMITVNR